MLSAIFLELLPLAVQTVREGNAHLKFPRGAAPDVLNPPKGTQVVYSKHFGKRTMKVFAYYDSGEVSGWHMAK